MPLAVALAGHALWLAWAGLSEGSRRSLPLRRAADDTPELLRFSRQASQPANLAAGLSTVNLPFDQTLPPPPPDLEDRRPGTSPTPGVAPRRTAGAKAAAANHAQGNRWGVAPTSPQGLPDDPATTLALAWQLADGEQDRGEASGRSGASDPSGDGTAEPPQNSEPAGAAAVARRQVRVSGPAERPWRGLWERASRSEALPASLADLPEGVEVKRLELTAARRLGLTQPHGISVLSGRSLLLLWADGDTLWLLQRKRPAAEG